MKLIVGLGNPGVKYQLTRHNIGFIVIDAFSQRLQGAPFKAEHQALTTRISYSPEETLLLVKPNTFMNLSGGPVQALMNYYRIQIEDLLVIHDDLDLEFGTIRFQTNRGHGGHNGIKSIHQSLARQDYKRLKVGIGRPSHPQMEISDYVLQSFGRDELKTLPDMCDRINESIEYFLDHGFEKTATLYNRESQRK